jgi:AcrR family transcriptional regulator
MLAGPPVGQKSKADRPKQRPSRERGEETRKRIVAAAMDLWAGGGSRGTGLADVAEQAGIGHPGLLHHFGSKDNLRLAVVMERDRQDLRRITPLFEAGGLNAIRALPEVARAAEERPGLAQLYLVLVTENLNPESAVHDWFVERFRAVRRLLAASIALGVERREIDEGINCERIASRIMAFMDGAEIQRLLDPAETNLVALYEDFARSLVVELARPPA